MNLVSKKSVIVDENQTATMLKSGDVAVYASPALMAKCEELAKDLVYPLLKEEETTVGIDFTLNHLKAAEVGDELLFDVCLVQQTNSILHFEYTVKMNEVLIAKGIHKRAIVNRQKFIENLRAGK